MLLVKSVVVDNSSFIRFFADTDQLDIKQSIDCTDTAAAELTKSFSILNEDEATTQSTNLPRGTFKSLLSYALWYSTAFKEKPVTASQHKGTPRLSGLAPLVFGYVVKFIA